MVRAIGECHKQNVVHRDLKPENILLDENGDIRIIDFGLGKVTVATERCWYCMRFATLRRSEMLLDTGYQGEKTDLWSLGVVLYAMLIGRLPFDEQDMGQLYDKIISASFHFKSAPSTLSKSAKELICGLLTADPEQRLTVEGVLRQLGCTFTRIRTRQI